MIKAHLAFMVVLCNGVLLVFTYMMFDCNQYARHHDMNGRNSMRIVKGNITPIYTLIY